MALSKLARCFAHQPGNTSEQMDERDANSRGDLNTCNEMSPCFILRVNNTMGRVYGCLTRNCPLLSLCVGVKKKIKLIKDDSEERSSFNSVNTGKVQNIYR